MAEENVSNAAFLPTSIFNIEIEMVTQVWYLIVSTPDLCPLSYFLYFFLVSIYDFSFFLTRISLFN